MDSFSDFYNNDNQTKCCMHEEKQVLDHLVNKQLIKSLACFIFRHLLLLCHFFLVKRPSLLCLFTVLLQYPHVFTDKFTDTFLHFHQTTPMLQMSTSI